jgi:hypothetical protein
VCFASCPSLHVCAAYVCFVCFASCVCFVSAFVYVLLRVCLYMACILRVWHASCVVFKVFALCAACVEVA